MSVLVGRPTVVFTVTNALPVTTISVRILKALS